MKKGFIEEKAKALHVSENAVIRLVDLAFKETDEQLPLLQQAIEKVDYDETQSISHRIKGYLLNLKFDELGNLAQEMNLLSQTHGDMKVIKAKFEQFITGFEALRKDVANG